MLLYCISEYDQTYYRFRPTILLYYTILLRGIILLLMNMFYHNLYVIFNEKIKLTFLNEYSLVNEYLQLLIRS